MDRKRLLNQAKAALENLDWEAAKPLFARLLSQLPKDPTAIELGGLYLLRTGAAEKAARLLKQGVAIDPNSLPLRLRLAQALSQSDEPDAAIEVLKLATQQFPKDPQSRVELARLLFQKSHGHRALEQLREAELLAAPDSETCLLTGRTLLSLQRVEEAQGYFERCFRETGDPEAAVLLGYALQRQGSFEEAREYFKAALERNPTLAKAYFGFAQGKKFVDEDRELLETLESLIGSQGFASESDVRLVQYVAAKGFEDLGEHERSFRHYEQANQLAFRTHLKGKALDARSVDELIHNATIYFNRERLAAPTEFTPLASRKPIFIFGMMRSGTTLIEQIISSHPDVQAGGELLFWAENIEKVFSLPSNVVRRQFQDFLRTSGLNANWVTDKMPSNYYSLGAIHLAFPEAPMIHVRRNPMDTCLSIYTTAYSASPDFAHDLESIRANYERYLRIMDHWRSALPAGRLIEVDYEDVVDRRNEVTRELADRIGLPWNEAMLSPEENRRDVNTPSVWQVRQPMYRTSVERWKRFEPWLEPLKPLLDKR